MIIYEGYSWNPSSEESRSSALQTEDAQRAFLALPRVFPSILSAVHKKAFYNLKRNRMCPEFETRYSFTSESPVVEEIEFDEFYQLFGV